MNIFQKAWQGLNLSPAERAWLKAMEGLLLTLLAVGTDAAMQFLALQGDLSKVSWTQVLFVFIGAVIVAVGQVAKKYFSAHGDAVLGIAVDTVATKIATQLTTPTVTTTTTVSDAPAVRPDITRGNTIAIVPSEIITPPLPPAA